MALIRTSGFVSFSFQSLAPKCHISGKLAVLCLISFLNTALLVCVNMSLKDQVFLIVGDVEKNLQKSIEDQGGKVLSRASKSVCNRFCGVMCDTCFVQVTHVVQGDNANEQAISDFQKVYFVLTDQLHVSGFR